LKAIIGLGNPGNEYKGTRHNAGFELVDRLNSQNGTGSFKSSGRHFAEISQVNLFEMPVLLAKPVTYMNDSGKALLAIKQFYKIALNDFLIIHDDISLPLGKIRLQHASGAGGQHGVESIIECLGGDKGFSRLKIGIGPDPGGDVRHHYVLQKFSANELVILDKVIEAAIKAISCWLKGDIDKAMNEFNGLDLR
jgi:peptidyl-tRNA hydrolase, PTH1 family